MPPEPLRIAVFGTGAVGGYFGGRLAQAGEDVIFLARGAHLAAITAQGLRVSSLQGDFVIQPANAVEQPVEAGPVDVVLLGVKAWQVADAAEAMRPMLRPGTFVVPLQNGVDAPVQLAEVIGPDRVLGGLCRVLASIKAPGHIEQSGVEPYIAFGELDGSSTERVGRLRAAFERTVGITVETPPDVVAAMWTKFLFISALSGVGAVTRSTAGVIRSKPETRGLLVQALEEARQVALAHGVRLPNDVVSRIMQSIDQLPEGGTASMQRDIAAGRPSELSSQSGAVVRLGREVGVPVPVHTLIYESLVPLERRAREKQPEPASAVNRRETSPAMDS
jgi:2-dehydropantoate 2-reductase